jgi:extradiol dioxygenase family protein
MTSPIHISVAVSNLAKARAFYGETLGLKEGRSGDKRIDYNFYGHHLVLHLCPEEAAHQS